MVGWQRRADYDLGPSPKGPFEGPGTSGGWLAQQCNHNSVKCPEAILYTFSYEALEPTTRLFMVILFFNARYAPEMSCVTSNCSAGSQSPSISIIPSGTFTVGIRT